MSTQDRTDRPDGEWWQDLAPVVPESSATRPPYRTVDVHTHLSVPAGTRLATPYLKPELEPRALYSSPETLRYNKEYRASARQTGQFEDAEVRLADMDRQGIDVQVLSVPPTVHRRRERPARPPGPRRRSAARGA